MHLCKAEQVHWSTVQKDPVSYPYYSYWVIKHVIKPVLYFAGKAALTWNMANNNEIMMDVLFYCKGQKLDTVGTDRVSQSGSRIQSTLSVRPFRSNKGQVVSS